MTDYYSPDLSTISLDKYFQLLKQKTMLPSRVSLQDNADSLLSELNKENLRTLADLADSLKTKKKVQDFASNTGLDQDLLFLLRREVLSWLPKPVLHPLC